MTLFGDKWPETGLYAVKQPTNQPANQPTIKTNNYLNFKRNTFIHQMRGVMANVPYFPSPSLVSLPNLKSPIDYP